MLNLGCNWLVIKETSTYLKEISRSLIEPFSLTLGKVDEIGLPICRATKFERECVIWCPKIHR